MLTQAIEAILFAAGKPVSVKTLCEILEKEKDEIRDAAQELEVKLLERNSGIQLIRLNDSYQLATLEIFYDYICKMLDNRPKPTLSQAALEVLAIIAYNPKITRAEMEKIRGVSSDSAMNKLLEYNLIEDAGRMDAPGRPVMYQTTDEFLKMFGYKSLKDLPDLPKLKEELEQIEIEDGIDTEEVAENSDTISAEEVNEVKDEIENNSDIANEKVFDEEINDSNVNTEEK